MKICPSRWPEARRLEPDQGLYKRLRMKPAAEHVRRVLFPGLLLGFQIGAAVAGPQGGTVVGGNGNISRPNDTTTVIQQQSQNLAIDWQKFDIKQNELVQFKQPGRDAQALNRIFDQNASQIHGRIDANGRVLLMNPNGVIFGRTAHVNVNGLVAAGMANIPVDDFMVGKFKLEALDHADGVVINHGTIEAATGGDVTLVGKAIQNDGIIIASAGRVNLAAGNKITLDFDGDGLMRFAIDEAVLKNTTALDHQISNAGTIEANGGDVAIAASAAQGVFTNAINNSGLIRATRIENVGGVIRLAGHGPSSSVLNTGTIDASADEPDSTGGDVEITGENVRQAGVVRVDAANAAGTIAMQATHALELGSDSTTSAISSVDSGGVVQALGNTVTLKAGANIDVSGATAGGVALVGGDVQGADPNIVNAQTTTVEEGATIIADANTDGDGGTVVVWSDGTTTFAGSISARGGAQAGNGGFAEVSGKQHILLHGFADMRAPNGEVGSLIVDPGTVILCAVAICGTQTGLDRFSDDHINSQLLLGDFGITTTTASTANGTAEDILVVDPSFALSWSANVLTLTAGRNLALDGSFTATGTAGLNLEFGASNGGGVLNLDTVLLAVANPITATGGAGSDTIFGPNEAVNWLTTATNDGSLTWTAPSPVTVNFTAADVLTGGSMTDTFNLSASFAGALNGGAGADNFIFADGITVGGSIDGGAADDRFNLGAGATIVGTIQGGANGINGDLVVGPNVANTWNINAIRGGDLGGVITFSGIENVAGGSNDDTFVLTSAAANIFLDGNAHVTNGDKINWSGFGSPANVILNSSVANGFGSSSATGLSGFQDIDILEGDGSSTLQGIAAGGVFNIDGIVAATNTYVSTGTLTFEGFSNLAGSATNADSFVFAAAGFSDSFVLNGGGAGAAAGTIDLSADITNRTYALTSPNAGNVSGGAGLLFSNIGSLMAGGGDVLHADNTANVFNITGPDSGDIDGAFTFTGFGFLEAGTGGDTFRFDTAAGALSGSIAGNAGTDVLDYSLRTGGDALSAVVNLEVSSASQVTGGFTSIEAVIGDGANDTLIGANGASNTFNLIGGDGTDDGNVNGTFTFTNFTDLQAGTSGATFVFDGANVLSGAITGDIAASDTLNYATATGGPLTFTVGGAALRVGSATNIDRFVGTATGDSLDGTAGIDTFTIDNLTSNNDVHVGGITYIGIENINGLAGADVFNVTGNHAGNLSGGSDPDTFNFGLTGETPVLTGQVDGGPGGGDVLDFTNFGGLVTAASTGPNRGDIAATIDPVVFGGDDYTQIEEVRGVGIQGADGVNHDWLITGLNAVTLDATSLFTDVAFIAGGNMTDTFTLEDDGRMTGLIDGGLGSDFLIADSLTDAAAVFVINAPDTGTVTVGGGTLTTTFMNIENLTGSDVNDQFNFSSTGSISEVIDGGLAGTDIVSLAATGLPSYTATIDGPAFGIANVDQIIGNDASSLVLAGGVLFTITGSNSGTVDGAVTTGITFTDWANLAGTAGVDTFDFDNGDISGTINGLGGADIADFENHDANISVVLSALGSTDGFQGSSLTDTGGFDNIDEFKARITGSIDSLTGANIAAVWTIDGTPQYVSTNTLDFSNFESLSGGLAVDSFVIANAFGVAMLDGGAGAASVVDTLDLSAYATALLWTINGDGGGAVNTASPTAFAEFEAFIGGVAIDAFNVTADSGLLNLFGPNPGRVDGGGGATNTISFAGRTTAVTVELDNVSNITAITGGTSNNDLITGTSAADTVTTSALNAGSFSGGIALTYTSFETVGGGANDDIFNIDHDVSGTVRGDAGSDVFNLDSGGVTVSGGLLGGADADTFNIRASVSTDIEGEAQDDSINVDPLGSGGIILTGNVSGGADNDAITVGFPTLIAPTGSTSSAQIIGQIDGGSGNDTLDYTGTNHGMLATVTGSGAGGDNIEFSGASVVVDFAFGDDVININIVTDNRLGTLVGPNEDTTWIVNGTNSGTFQGASAGSATGFTNFQIVGRGFVDTFILENGGQIVGLSGGPGVVGGGGIDAIVVANVGLGGPASENFVITASDEGVITTGAGATAFNLIESLVGNDGPGTVLVQAIWNGSIDGGAGGTDLQFDGTLGGQNAVLTADGATVGFQGMTAAIVGGFDNVTGLTNPAGGTTSLTGDDQVNTWNLLGANAGTVASAARSLTFTNFNDLIGGNVVDVFNVTANHSGNLTGNAGADQFVFTNTAVLSGSINGGTGVDTLDYGTYAGVVTVSILGSGTTDGFRGSELDAGSLPGTFDDIDQILAENGGGDTIVAPNATNIWTITGTDVFTLASGGSGPVGFTNFANLTGGTGTDTFSFTTGNVTGAINGSGGVNTLSYAGNAGSVSVILTGIGTSVGFSGTASGIGTAFDNISDLIGSADTDSLTGLNSASTWTLDGANYESLARQLRFSGTGVNAIENLIGGAGSDIFNLSASRSGDINGGNGNNTFNLSGVGTVVTGNLTSGTGVDQFNFNDNASITGTLDGGAGLDTLDWSGSTASVLFAPLGAGSLGGGIQGNLIPLITTTGPGFDNIDSITANNLLSIFVGNNDDTAWTIDGPNAFSVTSISLVGISFANFSSIIAGAGADDFTFAGGSLSGTIDGGGGANTLTADNRANLWTLTEPVAGTVTGLGGSFTNINDITGGNDTDRFTVLGASSFAGQVDGALGINTLVGGNVANNWNLTGPNQGNIGGLTSFMNVARLEGGSGADTFNFANTATIGGLDAGAGNDILNYAAVMGPVLVNLATGETPLIAAGSGLNFEQIIGTGAAGDTLIGANTNNNWNISGIGSGTVGGISFSAFENLTGGSATDNFLIGAANRVTGNLNGGAGIDTISQPFASLWRTTGLNAGSTNGVAGTFANVENLTAPGTTANLDIDGGSILGTYTATTISLDPDGTSVTGGAPIKIAGNLVANANQSINTGSALFSVSNSLTGSNAAYVINASAITVGGSINTSSVNFSSANTNVGAVTTTGSQIYNGSTNFRGNLDGGNMVFNGPSIINGDVLLRSTINGHAFNGPVSGAGNLDIIPTANTDIFIGNGSGPGTIAASQFGNFQGHLIIGALLNPLDSPAEAASVVSPPGVTADLIVVGNDFPVGGDVTLIGHNINLAAGISAGVAGQVTLVAVGDIIANGEGPGDITGPTSGTAVIGGSKAVLIANNTVINPGNIRFDLSNGDLLLAVSASESEPVFDAGSSANSVDFDPLSLALIAGLGLNLQAVQVVFSNPAAALTGLQNVQFIDAGLFEEDLSLFGVIGNGIAMSLDQCEEAEGCAPNITTEELDFLIAQLEARIAEIERRSANGTIDGEEGTRLLGGFRQELTNFETYKQQLADYNASQQDFTAEFGEIDEFTEPFDDPEPESGEAREAADPVESVPAKNELPRFAVPEPLPELEPGKEADEALDDDVVEPEAPTPTDKFEELEEEIIPFEDLDDEFEEFEEVE